MMLGADELHFFYDAQNKPAVVVYNGVPYSYVKNLQGDIVAILDSSKNVVVSYVYDAWGRPISKTGSMAGTLGTVQPFRYRGYVYDEEMGLYYLLSRYFRPAWCRFLNIDIVVLREIIGSNLCCYSLNNPVLFVDSTGTRPTTSRTVCTVCVDPGLPPRTSWHSDNRELSNRLIAYLQESNSWSFSRPVHVDVQYTGVYKNTESMPWFDEVVSGLGVLVTVLPWLFPGVREMAAVTTACQVIGPATTLVGFASAIAPNFAELKNEEYYQFTVTITATNVTYPETCTDMAIITHYKYTQIYLWNNEHLENPQWHLLDTDYSISSEILDY